MKKQGYNARKDEQLGMTRGKQSGKKMSMAGRRKVAKATRKPKGTYGLKKSKSLIGEALVPIDLLLKLTLLNKHRRNYANSRKKEICI